MSGPVDEDLWYRRDPVLPVFIDTVLAHFFSPAPTSKFFDTENAEIRYDYTPRK